MSKTKNKTKLEAEETESGIKCVFCGGIIKSYIIGKNKEGRYEYPKPEFKEGEHENIKDCIKHLNDMIVDLQNDVWKLESKT